jgi:hypothetical protein
MNRKSMKYDGHARGSKGRCRGLSRTATLERLLAFTTDRKCDVEPRSSNLRLSLPSSFSSLSMENSAKASRGPFTSLISRLWDSLLLARKVKEMSFAAVVSRRPRTLTNYCGRAAMLTREARASHNAQATGVRLDEISLRQNLISSRARVRGNAIERLARIGYPALPRKRVGYVRRSHENRIEGRKGRMVPR